MCFDGYDGMSCETQLCPEGKDAAEGILCSGNGDCDGTTGTCICRNSYSGRDCSNVPGCVVDSSDCGTGTCDSQTGACVCPRGTSGKDCEVASAPTVVDVDVDLAFGVGNFSWSNSYTVDSKEYRFFRAEVDDSLYDVTIYARSLSGDAHVYIIGYDAVGLDTDLPNSATKIWESSKSDRAKKSFISAEVLARFLATWTLQPTAAPQISAFFLGNANIFIGVLGFEFQKTTEFQIAVVRSGCAQVNCGDHGHCESGACVCAEGWRGQLCDVYDCPGEPDCSGRGTCMYDDTTLPSNTSNPENDRRLAAKGDDKPYCSCYLGFAVKTAADLPPVLRLRL